MTNSGPCIGYFLIAVTSTWQKQSKEKGLSFALSLQAQAFSVGKSW